MRCDVLCQFVSVMPMRCDCLRSTCSSTKLRQESWLCMVEKTRDKELDEVSRDHLLYGCPVVCSVCRVVQPQNLRFSAVAAVEAAQPRCVPEPRFG
nr:hypothetical protein CFP56_11089 [Quercus suber]